MQPEVLTEVSAHALAEELLPPIAILRQGGVGVALLQAWVVRVGLLVGGVDTCRGRVEEALCLLLLCGLQHVRIDQDRQHAQCLVVLDETHTAHVGGEVVDVAGVGERRCAGLL